ncbi:MAG: hypothetical protein HY519_04480 [Candidatus Aenigmarchaeota archaeon]|nr:hypothetical protein [Candidatus Aenigmarchaeota archaeon]
MEETQKKEGKWKGKDWYAICLPELFDKREIGEVPATDPQLVIGRIMEISAGELTGDSSKLYLKLRFKVNKVEGKVASTTFSGITTVREHASRMVRKRAEKVDAVENMATKDGWELQVSALGILNRNTYSHIGGKVRHLIIAELRKAVSKLTMDEMIEAVVSKTLQKKVREAGNKIYPLRAFDIVKVEVLKAGGNN